MTVANYSEKDVHVYRIPQAERQEIREAWENNEFLWLVKKWNDHKVTNTRLCSTCPESIRVVQAFTPLLWQESI